MKKATVDKFVKSPEILHLKEVKMGLVLYLDARGYNNAQIGQIFNMTRSGIKKIVDKNKPKGATK